MHDHKSCPICGGTDRYYLIRHPRNGGAPYWRCRQCDHTAPHDEDDPSGPWDAAFRAEPEDAPRQVYDPATLAAIYRAYDVIATRCAAALWTPAGRAALEYLRGRGLTDDTIRDLRLGWSGDGEDLLTDIWRTESGRFDVCRTRYEPESVYDMAYLGGLRMSGAAPRQVLKYTITIPYYAGGACVWLRGRKLRPRPDEPKYLSPAGPMYAGGPAHLYLCDDIAGASGVIVTEGEIKAMLARQEWRAGRSPYPCVATPGASYWTEAFTEALRGKTVYLAFDNDRNGAGKNAALRVARILRSAGVAVRIATLPRRADAEKTDLDAYILEARYA